MKKTGDWKDLFVMGMGGFNGGHNILCDKCASILIGIKTYTIANIINLFDKINDLRPHCKHI